MSTAIYRSALAAAASDLENLGPHALARPDTRGGWVLEVHNVERATGYPPHEIPEPAHVHIDSMSDGTFPGASAGHRLIEHGWIIHPSAHYADNRTSSGWLHQHGLYTAPVTPTGPRVPAATTGEAPDYESDTDILGADLLPPENIDDPDKHT